MDIWTETMAIQLLVGCLALGVLLLLAGPLKRLFGLVFRTGVGLALLSLFSQVGGFVGVSLGANLFNALILALLGVPGFGLLLLLHWSLILT